MTDDELLKEVRKIVRKIRDPWLSPRTHLWLDGTYDGDGSDLTACRDAVHDIKEMFRTRKPVK